MNEDIIKKLLAAMNETTTPAEAYRFHWTVANRIPLSYGRLSFLPQIGIDWLDHKQEIRRGPVLYNDKEPSTWGSVSNREECAQVVACQVIFDADNVLTDIQRTPKGQCLINGTWTIAPKSGATQPEKGGKIKLTDMFELRWTP